MPIRTYLERTKCWRKGDHDQLLLSFRQPHGAVTTSSIARWLKLGMAESGIDTQKFKAHSTRGQQCQRPEPKGYQLNRFWRGQTGSEPLRSGGFTIGV